ncbi:hypothetical protein HZU75_16655 [Chitinibacter fontanus]|uniref:Zona occludens toxin N-terminal domain-containing protein n=1 Tax=Chitinibacter fontanus TaxID=1737446 RepID=A0A7D5ZB97_9NEIS|nr:zonular occludens toxin domain-containing protein [Chitinibacter fontanus]QLI83022.1 hypothetical protein HZU75_16655 [Chitinibacter fontanus]
MSILIYSGAPGSYKTYSAVNEQVIPAIKAGRVIVTNIRGLTTESCLEFFPDAPDSFEVIHVDTSLKEGRDKFARFFHWAPHGAFIIVDEAQYVFPSRWRDRELSALDFPLDETKKPADWPAETPFTAQDCAQVSNRPPDFVTAFDMHRHYNWDMVFTTPNIAKIHTEIRQAAEGGYHHKNLAVLGALFKGHYTQGYHDAQDPSKPSSYVTIERKRANKRVFKLYKSTATGTFSDTKAGTSIFKDPKILLLLFMAIAPFIYVGLTGLPHFLGGSPKSESVAQTQASKPATVAIPQVVVAQGSGAVIPASVNSQHDGAGTSDAFVIKHPLLNSSVRVIGRMQSSKIDRMVFEVRRDDGTVFTTDNKKLTALGYKVEINDDCLARIVFFPAQVEMFASCTDSQPHQQLFGPKAA